MDNLTLIKCWLNNQTLKKQLFYTEFIKLQQINEQYSYRYLDLALDLISNDSEIAKKYNACNTQLKTQVVMILASFHWGKDNDCDTSYINCINH